MPFLVSCPILFFSHNPNKLLYLVKWSQGIIWSLEESWSHRYCTFLQSCAKLQARKMSVKMDPGKVTKDEKVPVKKKEAVKMIVEMNVKAKETKKKQDEIVKKLKMALNFLEEVNIEDDESLINISKPVEDLLTSLKYFPTNSLTFCKLPTELKTEILSYLCDPGAFLAASVCQEWRNILEDRLRGLESVSLGRCCSARHCQNYACYKPEEMMKASLTHNLDLCLRICHPITQVDSTILVKALTNVSKLEITGDCGCREDDGEHFRNETLSKTQFNNLFQALDNNSKVKTLTLKSVDLSFLDQDQLIGSLLGVQTLTLEQGFYMNHDKMKMLDSRKFIKRLVEDGATSTLTNLTLEYLDYPEEWAKYLARGLAKITNVTLGSPFLLKRGALHHLLMYILSKENIRMKTLNMHNHLDWRLLKPKCLKALFTKFEALSIYGKFSGDQLEVVKALQDVKTTNTRTFNTRGVRICKGVTD